MSYENIKVINNLINLACNLVEEGSEHKSLLLELEKCDAKFRRHGPEVCTPKDFYRYARPVLGIFGKIIDGADKVDVDSVAQDMISKISKNYQSDLFYRDACGLCIYEIYKTKGNVYTFHQIPKQRSRWLETTCKDDGKINLRPIILFPEHMEFYNSLSTLEQSLIHAAFYKGSWEDLFHAYRKKPYIVRIAKKLERYEQRNGIKLDPYSMQSLLGGKNGRK